MASSLFSRLRDESLLRRKYLIPVGAVAAALLLVVGVALFIRALDENGPITASVINVPTRVGLLFSYDEPDQVVNYIVFFNDVRIEPGPSDDLYYAIGAGGKRVLVRSEDSKAPTDSNLVDLKGTVRILPSTYTLKTKWKLTKDEIKAAREQGIYVEADRVTARRSTPANVARK